MAEHIPVGKYRGIVDPKSIDLNVISSSSDEENPPKIEVKRKRPNKNTTSKKIRGSSFTTTPTNGNHTFPSSHHTNTTNNNRINNNNNNNNNARKEVIELDDDDDDELRLESEKPVVFNPLVLMHKNAQVAKAFSIINQNRMLRDQIRRSDSVSHLVSNVEDTPTTSNVPSESILFSIYESNEDAHPLKFRCYKTEPFHKLLNAYCQYKQYKTNPGTLKWYGITLDSNKTPADFNMTAEERLTYARLPSVPSPSSNSQQPLSQTHAQTTDSQPQIEEEEESDSIVLKVRYENQTKKFRIKKTDPLQKLLDAFCSKNNLDAAKMNLIVDGLPVQSNTTSLDHDLESDDLIDLKSK